MIPVRMIAKRAFPYANKQLRTGDAFDAQNMTDALLLEQSGNAARDQTETKRAYRRRDMRAEH